MNNEVRTILLTDYVSAAGALTAALLNDLSNAAKLQVAHNIDTGAAHLELRTRVQPLAVELVLVPMDGQPVMLAHRSDLH